MHRFTMTLILLVGVVAPVHGQKTGKAVSNNAAKQKTKPIRALLVTGECCHDYQRQRLILARGISARANVVWTVVQQGGTTTNLEFPRKSNKL